MGGLSHFFEDEGIPTTQISLVRLHTEIIRPPRALWVPFELGRPLGVPNDPDFQKRVVVAALRLLEAKNGPVLVDYPEEAPAGAETLTGLSCPVSLKAADRKALSGPAGLCEALKREMASLMPWYDMAVKERGRTTVGVSGLEPDGLADFICAFLEGRSPASPRPDLALPYALNLATDDLKAFYMEAVTAQPGQRSPGSKVVADWFWGETVAGKVLLSLRDLCANSDDGLMKLLGRLLIVPVDQAHRKASD